jgi:hypothetical protein
MSGLQNFRIVVVGIPGGRADRELDAHCETYDQAIESAVESLPGFYMMDDLPLDLVVRDARGHARRFRCEIITDELAACRVCGCAEDRACDPPCAWAENDLCDNPKCLEAAKRGAMGAK